eukprot:Pompholyxophrys_punicea_v1_NODE_61_length_4021_cov_11.209730.p1 type:complete len:262 gc:universal NODE_61_length_4021_cov_11.209730:3730-2945(-)
MDNEEALALFLQIGLSKASYLILRSNAVKHGLLNFYPPYQVIQAEKQKCCPKNVIATPLQVSSSLQSLLDHTVERLLSTCTDVLLHAKSLQPSANTSTVQINEPIKLDLLSKWGFDGSGSQATYSQTFLSGPARGESRKRKRDLEECLPPKLSDIPAPNSNELDLSGFGKDGVVNELDDFVPALPPSSSFPNLELPKEGEYKDDESLLATSLVPLVLKFKEMILWKNPFPGSSRLCRPIHLQHIKETVTTSKKEEEILKIK